MSVNLFVLLEPRDLGPLSEGDLNTICNWIESQFSPYNEEYILFFPTYVDGMDRTLYSEHFLESRLLPGYELDRISSTDAFDSGSDYSSAAFRGLLHAISIHSESPAIVLNVSRKYPTGNDRFIIGEYPHFIKLERINLNCIGWKEWNIDELMGIINSLKGKLKTINQNDIDAIISKNIETTRTPRDPMDSYSTLGVPARHFRHRFK